MTSARRPHKYSREYYLKNKEKIKAASASNYAKVKDLESTKTTRRAWYDKNRVTILKKAKLRRQKEKDENPEAERQRSKLSMRKWRAENPSKAKAARLRQRYGLTDTQYRSMLEAQNGRCAVCRRLPSEVHNKRVKDLAVDHDGRLDKDYGVILVRGLLCMPCNSALGGLLEDPETIVRLAQYAKRCRIVREQWLANQESGS